MRFIESFWWRALVAMLVLTLWVFRPFGASPPAQIDTAFDETRARAHLAAILPDDTPHPVDSEAADALIARLVTEIEGLGFAPEIRDRFHCNDQFEGSALCARLRNVVFWATAPGPDAILLVAHHDSVAASPGAGDDLIGVASALEIARVVAEQGAARPLLVLLTDGEEDGLMGAAMFAAHDPLAAFVGAVVNVEARSLSGPAMIFQTMLPNGREAAALGGRPVPFANSIDTDLKPFMPYDTDFTPLSVLGADGVNAALTGSSQVYHTPADDLASFEPRSVRHLGATALAAVEGFAEGGGSDAQQVFVTVPPLGLLAAPPSLALALVALSLGAGAFLAWRLRTVSLVGAVFRPLLAMLAGLAAAVAATLVVGAIRPESAFAAAQPLPLRALQAGAALLGAAFVLSSVRAPRGAALIGSAWAWLCLPVLGVFAFVPGATTILLPGAALMILAGLLAAVPGTRRLAIWPALGAGAASLVLFVPFAAIADLQQGQEQGAPYALLLAGAYLLLAPSGGGRSWPLLAGLGVVAAAGLVGALLVPAYDEASPQHLTIIHEDYDGESQILIHDTGPLPKAMRALMPFADRPDGFGRWTAPAPAPNLTESITQTVSTDGARTRIVLEAPMADRHELRFETDVPVRAVSINGARVSGDALRFVRCAGRACRRIELLIETDAPLPRLRWQAQAYGPGVVGAPLAAARPPYAQPVHVGDRQEVFRFLTFEGLAFDEPRSGETDG